MSKCFTQFCASVYRAFFYGNFFLSVLVVVLAIETAFQLRVPLANSYYYLTTALGVYLYYSYAYTRYEASYDERGRWYVHFQNAIRRSQHLALIFICLLLPKWIFDWISNWLLLHWTLQFFFLSFPLLGIGYYSSHLPTGLFNIRKRGWSKPFVIGYVWAGVVSVYPLLFLPYNEFTAIYSPETISYFLFSWSFFTVNALLFDIKDQKIDAHFALPTFIVRLGVSKTIARVACPLVGLSLSSLLFFAYSKNFMPIQLICNIIPFMLLCGIIWVLKQRQKSVLYYLIVIDGLLLVKALVGILGVFLLQIVW